MDGKVEVEGHLSYLPDSGNEESRRQQAHTVDGKVEVEGHLSPLQSLIDEEAHPQPSVQRL